MEELKRFLALSPYKGDVIPGTGGVRKLRWARAGIGKRGGARVLYFYYVSASHIYLMTCYSKSEQEDIGGEEKKLLRKVIEQLTNILISAQ